MIKHKQIAVLVLMLALLSGCGLIFTGSTAEVSFTTDPDDASIYLDNRLIGKGPTTVEVSRSVLNGTPVVRVERQGYKTQEFKLKTKFNTVSLINLTSAPSWTTDFVSGAMFEYAPSKYHIQLVKNDSASLSPEQRVTQLVMMNFVRFRSDLASGEGETIDSVVQYIAGETGYDAGIVREKLLTARQALVGIDSPLGLAAEVNRLVTSS